jgi:transcriptional regulator of acetoin/glycerol metabolism
MIRHPAGDRHWTRQKPDLIKRGADSHAAKLSEQDITLLYQFADAGWLPSEIARHFGVSRITVWRHLKTRSLHT